MIVIKNNGSILENLNNEILKDIISKNNTLAIVNRALSYKENRVEIEGSDDYVENIYQDDITPGEIQAGTQAVKEYCLANNLMDLYYEYALNTASESEKLNIISMNNLRITKWKRKQTVTLNCDQRRYVVF